MLNIQIGDNFSSTDHSFIGPSWIYSKQKSHFRSSYRQISKILQSQVESKQKFPIKIFIHNPFLFQAEIFKLVLRSRNFENYSTIPSQDLSIKYPYISYSKQKLHLNSSYPNFVVQNRVSKSQFRSLVHQNIYNPFLFQLHFNSQILSRNFENYSTSPKSRAKVSTSPPPPSLPFPARHNIRTLLIPNGNCISTHRVLPRFSVSITTEEDPICPVTLESPILSSLDITPRLIAYGL